MKVPKLTWPLFAMCLAATGCEEKPAEPEAAADAAKASPDAAKAADPAAAAAAKPAEAPPPPPKEPPMPPPAEACATFVTAVKAKDEAKMMALSTPTTGGALAAEGAKDHLMGTLMAATCGAAKVEGDAATVSVTSGETVQDLPFVKAADGWKFDGTTYLSKYPPPEKAADKGKAGKGKHAKGKPGKGKHHKK